MQEAPGCRWVDAPSSSEVWPPGFEGHLFCLAMKLPKAQYFARKHARGFSLAASTSQSDACDACPTRVPVPSKFLQLGFRIPTETPELLHGAIQSPCFWRFPPALISEQLGNSCCRLSLKTLGLCPPFCLSFPLVKMG